MRPEESTPADERSSGGGPGTGGAAPRIVLVDDHALFRSGVRAELEGRCEIVGEAGDAAEAVRVILETSPDVVLLDVHLPGGGGVAVLREVLAARPDQAFLALTVSDAAEDVVATVRAGAKGYVQKTIAADELVAAIEQVRAGEPVFSPRLAGFVLRAFSDAPPPGAVDAEVEQLTPREREVLQLIARGYAYKQIGQRLSISPRTVETHTSAVLRKLQLTSRHELSRWAARRGLVDD
ncbi:MAG: response regulator transcription factor [Solirubrobacteraceae bacterium]|nr:response regulator transcription factor [Solirubrobacteraceae bacterium]